MSELMNALVGLSGLLAAVVVMIIVYFITRKYGKKKHLYDERQKHVSTYARAASWNVTFVVLLVAWGIVILVEGISFSFFLMTGLYVAHCISFLFTCSYYASRN